MHVVQEMARRQKEAEVDFIKLVDRLNKHEDGTITYVTEKGKPLLFGSDQKFFAYMGMPEYLIEFARVITYSNGRVEARAMNTIWIPCEWVDCQETQLDYGSVLLDADGNGVLKDLSLGQYERVIAESGRHGIVIVWQNKNPNYEAELAAWKARKELVEEARGWLYSQGLVRQR